VFNLSAFQSKQLGAAVGIAGSIALFFCMPAYHNLIVWQWTHFWWLAIPGAVLGLTLALIEE